LRKIYNNTNIHIDNLTSGEEFQENKNNKNNKNNNKIIMRNVSAIFSLNDGYDGGEFIFPDFDLSIKLKKGSVIMFPPYWTHLHGTKPLLNDTYRYTVNTWYAFEIKN
jgi:predicted 2-oxoglutarate/Fe(II)-dependent dioxygenase YbiX